MAKGTKLKTSRIILWLGLSLSVLVGLDGLQTRSHASDSGKGNRSTSVRKTPDIQGVASNLPISFERNVGQFDQRARYSARTTAYNVFLTQNGAVFDFISTKKEPRKPLALKFQNANPKSPIDGVETRTELRNYFIGRDQKKWHTDVPTFRAVSYHDIYPGIDLSWYGNGQQLE